MKTPRGSSVPFQPIQRLRHGLRLMMIRAVFSILLIFYMASYYQLSRRGIREAPEYGIAGFLYIPCAQTVEPQDVSRHYALVLFYAPLNWIDSAAFGSPSPCICLMRLID